VEIDFQGGITCIVGPNGCGKSNVSDSIRWVLGEQSSRALRGSQMQDVIFKGTENRKPLGYCEVSLYFDNTAKIFPIEYDEVVLTRKLFKSGESEYFINKKSARLRDITGLLHDSGIDRDGLTIISQGQVAEIVTSRPETRRGIFEEAAGIAKFKHTKVEAERKLERTTAELVRVYDVINEIDKSRAPLLRQAETAQKYIALRDELKNLEVNTFVTMYDNASAQKSAIDAELYKIDEIIKQKQDSVADLNSQICLYNMQVDGLDSQIDAMRDQILHLSVDNERTAGNKRFEIFEKINEMKQTRAALVSKKHTIENLIESGEGYKFAVRKLTETRDKNIVGVVAKELTVPANLECAVEVALGAAAQNIITNDEDGAKKLIEYLKKQNLGRATFLPITAARGRTLDASELRIISGKKCVLGVASDLVKYNAKIKPVVLSLLGRTIIVDNLDNAIGVVKDLNYSCKIVTLDGDVIETRGSVTGGSKNALNNNLWHTNTLAQINDEIASIDREITKIDTERTHEFTAMAQRNEGQARVDAVRGLMNELAQKKDLIRTQIAQIETDKIKTGAEISDLTHEYYKTEVAKQKIDINLEQITTRIDEEYGLNYSAAFMYLTEIGIAKIPYENLEIANNAITTLRRKINAIGGVNLDAIEQSRIAQERYDDYSAQVADLEHAKADLEKVIRDLGTEMITKFNQSFEQINKNFGHVFRELFGGGTAKLELVPDADGNVDVLSCGIDIVAEPPGKKLANLTLLSGGEKALTAIAILFAILKLKPMPFCLLDEIEAALDEANVARFANYLQKFARDTQFIVITHRKPTMELADNLYGVTMEERGVTKIVSVKLENWNTAETDNEIKIDLPSGRIHA
jgi:chromosome segregation protein